MSGRTLTRNSWRGAGHVGAYSFRWDCGRSALTPKYAHLATFFAGFCLIANGLYLAAGSFTGVGDAGDLLRHGAAAWQLVMFGAGATALGFCSGMVWVRASA